MRETDNLPLSNLQVKICGPIVTFCPLENKTKGRRKFLRPHCAMREVPCSVYLRFMSSLSTPPYQALNFLYPRRTPLLPLQRPLLTFKLVVSITCILDLVSKMG